MAEIKQDMTQGSVAENLLRFSFPIFLSYLFQALYGSVDVLIVGRFSGLANVTGVTQGNQIMHILTQAVSGLTTGAGILIARYTGEKKEADLMETIQTIFTLFLLLSLALAAAMLLLNKRILCLLEIPEEAMDPALGYLRICELGMVFIFLYNCIAAVMQALGDSRHPFLFITIACIINVALDLVFVLAFGMGAQGTALATVISQMISVFLLIRFLRRNTFPFRFHPGQFRVFRDKLDMVLRLGVPYALQRGIVACSFLAISGLANGYGISAASAAGVVSKINNFATMPFSAIQSAIATAAGQNMGAGRLDRANHTFLVGLTLNFTIGASLFTLVQLMPGTCLSLFSPDEEMIRCGIPFLRFFALEYLLMPFSYSIHALLSASGRTILPAVNGLFASVICRIPLSALVSSCLGFPGVALGSSLAVLGAVIPASIFYFMGVWKRPKLGKSSVSQGPGK